MSLISVAKAADAMGVSRQTAYRMARSGSLPGLVKLTGRRLRVRSAVLDARLRGGAWDD